MLIRSSLFFFSPYVCSHLRLDINSLTSGSHSFGETRVDEGSDEKLRSITPSIASSSIESFLTGSLCLLSKSKVTPTK